MDRPVKILMMNLLTVLAIYMKHIDLVLFRKFIICFGNLLVGPLCF